MSGIHEKMSVDRTTGVVHIPATHRSAPGHPKGAFLYKDNKLDGGGKKHMQMMPNHSNVFIEFTLPRDVLRQPKSYNLMMRFQTNQDQQLPLQLAIKRGDRKQKDVCNMEIPLPNTHNKWETTEPMSVKVELGADTILIFTHPKPDGKGILIRDFNLIPKGADRSGPYSGEWFVHWLGQLKAKAKECAIPQLDPKLKLDFKHTCNVAYTAYRKGDQTNEEEVKKEAEEELKQAMQKCLQAAKPILEGTVEPSLDLINFKEAEGKELLQAIVVAHGTPIGLADYAAKGEEQTKRLKDFLQGDSPDLMYQMLIHGGPAGGNYGRALDILAQIEAKRQQGKSVLPKLALAVALELSEPLKVFGQGVKVIDPIQRYLHYEEAYLDRELDPAFEHFSVWEFRMIVNSDAPNEQLSWFRAMLRNYNPHIATMDDYHWRFARIVRTDVFYKHPEWTRSPRDYMQIVSGGGMCGPRAWMGRFACKAFGNPTWGVRQPGHAAMTRWTPTGWKTALGGGFRVSFWEHRDGLDFECETKIRMSIGDEAYFKQVGLLDWIVHVLGESQNVSYVVPHKIWPALAIVQRQQLSKGVQPKVENNGHCEILSRIEELRESKPPKETITAGDDGSIIVPIATRSAASGDLMFMDSFLGGKQVFLTHKQTWEMTFKLPKAKFPEKKLFKMTARFVTVHENEDVPFHVSVSEGGKSNLREYTTPYSYTWGKWQETDPIDIVLGGSDEIMKVSRKEPKFPVTLKDIKLTPC